MLLDGNSISYADYESVRVPMHGWPHSISSPILQRRLQLVPLATLRDNVAFCSILQVSKGDSRGEHPLCTLSLFPQSEIRATDLTSWLEDGTIHRTVRRMSAIAPRFPSQVVI
jgi:hypothetical protein